MRKTIAFILLAVACAISSACALPAQGQQAHWYLTKPARQFQTDTTADGVAVFFDVATVAWLNTALFTIRQDLLEGGTCLHIASRQPPDGFKVDSVGHGERMKGDTTTYNWRKTHVECPADGNWAPLHFHVVIPEMKAWLKAVQLDSMYLDAQCKPSPPDRNPYFARYPFNAMMCGFGTDSIITYRVRKR